MVNRKSRRAAAGRRAAAKPKKGARAGQPGTAQMLDRAVARHQAGDLEAAAKLYRAILEVAPEDHNALHLFGVVALQSGKPKRARELIEAALRHRPEFAAACSNLGLALAELDLHEEAVAAQRRALAQQPDYPAAYSNLGMALQALGRHQEAIEAYDKAIDLQADYPEALNNLGTALRNQGDVDDAIARLNRAIALRQDYEEAHNTLGVCLLLKGDFERGAAEYEWRWKTKGMPKPDHPGPEWRGEDFAGKTLLLYAEQGLGDTIQFARYAPLVKARGGRVIVECKPALVPLLSGIGGIDALVARGEPLPDFDLHAPLLSLMRIMGTTQETIPD